MSRAPDITLSFNPTMVSDHGVVEPCAALFLATAEREGLTHVRTTEVPRATTALEGVGPFALSWRGDEAHDAVLTLDGAVAMLTSHHGACEITVAAAEPGAAERHAAALAARLRDEPPAEDVVRVSFWSGDDGYPRRRRIDAPAFEEVAGNYPSRTREAVGRLAQARGPGPGALLLWHGPPGTGKTHALRALARAWREWATVHYVTDAERFLASPGYLMRVATRGSDSGEHAARLVVLEDAGELVAADARSEIGQGLSRVLNLADGLLGQGIPCVLLITTNEPLRRMHPAIRRPGRCWAEVEFPAFPPGEAAAWLALRGVERDVRAPATLAELYAVAEGRELASPPAVGFGFARAAATAAPPASSTAAEITK